MSQEPDRAKPKAASGVVVVDCSATPREVVLRDPTRVCGLSDLEPTPTDEQAASVGRDLILRDTEEATWSGTPQESESNK
jgi:hypothetical protein